MIIADLVQKEYVKLHKSSKSEKVEFVKKTLEDLLANSLAKEKDRIGDVRFQKEEQSPFGGREKDTETEKANILPKLPNQGLSKSESIATPNISDQNQ